MGGRGKKEVQFMKELNNEKDWDSYRKVQVFFNLISIHSKQNLSKRIIIIDIHIFQNNLQNKKPLLKDLYIYHFSC